MNAKWAYRVAFIRKADYDVNFVEFLSREKVVHVVVKYG